MASRDILTNELSASALDRVIRMPAWFEMASRSTVAATTTGAAQANTDWSWLESDTSLESGVEVIEHHVPAALLVAFFGPAINHLTCAA